MILEGTIREGDALAVDLTEGALTFTSGKK